MNKHQKGCTVWFTGLSGAGKTTLCLALEKYLFSFGISCYCLDGDHLRKGLNADLGFSDKDRHENIRRAGEVAKLFSQTGLLCLASFISPFESDRRAIRLSHEKDHIPYIEVYVNTPLETCKQRDVKGLYKKATSGEIKLFTGISHGYEPPINPDLSIDTSYNSVKDCISVIVKFLIDRQIIHLESDIRELFVHPTELESKIKESYSLPRLELNDIDLQWLHILAEGWSSPLKGFMTEKEFLQSIHFNVITQPDGNIINQSIPLTLAINDEDKKKFEGEKAVALCHKNFSSPLAILRDPQIYLHRKEERIARTFGTLNQTHPAIQYILKSGDWLIGGKVGVLQKIVYNDGLDKYRLSPRELKEKFQQLDADAVFVFQLRNPIHNCHAFLMRKTEEKLISEGAKRPVLLLHPIGGWTKDDDVPLHVRIKQHEAVIDAGVMPKHTILAIFPSPMQYAGPTEVQWHCRARLVAGCKYYIVGRDPAGLKVSIDGIDTDLYDPSHGQMVLQEAPGLKGKVKFLPFPEVAYNKIHKQMMILEKSKIEEYEFISGTKMRKIAREGGSLPDGFMVPTGWNVLSDYYKTNTPSKL